MNSIVDTAHSNTTILRAQSDSRPTDHWRHVNNHSGTRAATKTREQSKGLMNRHEMKENCFPFSLCGVNSASPEILK